MHIYNGLYLELGGTAWQQGIVLCLSWKIIAHCSSKVGPSKILNTHMSHEAHMARTYPGFCGKKHLGVK